METINLQKKYHQQARLPDLIDNKRAIWVSKLLFTPNRSNAQPESPVFSLLHHPGLTEKLFLV